MRSIKIIIFFLIITSSCNLKKENFIKTFNIETATIQEFKKLKTVLSDVKFIYLQKDSSHQIGKIFKILFRNGKIYISDRFKTKALFIYQKDGKLIKIISKLGKGEGEYLDLTDFNINPTNNNIYIYDAQLRKILIYSDNGDFVRTVKFDFIAGSFVLSNGKIIFDKFNMLERNGNNIFDNNLIVCNKEGKPIKGYLPIDKELFMYNFGPMNGLRKYKNHILYLPPISNQIFSYNAKQESISKLYYLDFGKKWPDDAFFKANLPISHSDIFKKFKQKGLINFLNFIENDKYLCIGFYLGADKVLGFISKADGRYRLYKMDESPFDFLPMSVDEAGNFVNVIYKDAYDIMKNPEIIPENKYEDIKSNIILIKYKINEKHQ